MSNPVEQNRKVSFKRIMLSFLLAPPLGTYVFVIALFFIVNTGNTEISFQSILGALKVSFYATLYGIIVAYPTMLSFGLITTIIFDYNRINSAAAYALAGCTAGIATVYFLIIKANEPEIIEPLCMAGLAGVSCALCSWFIMTYKRTD